MKVLLVNNGFFGVTLPLVREMSKSIDCTLNIQIEANTLKESILAYEFRALRMGVPIEGPEVFGIRKELARWIGTRANIVFSSYRSRSFRDWSNWRVSLKWDRWVRRERFDLIHYNGTSMIFLQHLLLNSDLPKVFTIHDHVSHLGEEAPHVRWLYRYMAMKRNHFFIGQSDFVSKGFASLFKVPVNRMQTIPFGPVDLYKVWDDPSVVEDPYTVLFFGRISPYKGLEYLVEAWKTVRKRVPKARLIIAGPGKLYFDMVDVVQDSTITLHNRFMENGDLVRLIRGSAIVVLPYVEATQSAVVMTAYAFSKPVIATKVGGLPEIVEPGGTGLLVPPKDAQMLANAISDLLDNPTLRNQMASRISEKMKREFSWESLAKDTILAYQATHS